MDEAGAGRLARHLGLPVRRSCELRGEPDGYRFSEAAVRAAGYQGRWRITLGAG
jgi:hypothetical protein